MILVFITFFSLISSANDGNIENQFSYYRCSFKTEKSLVRHYFTLDKNIGVNCSYGIEVNDKITFQGKAFTWDCSKFIKDQINKGSVCMSSDVF